MGSCGLRAFCDPETPLRHSYKGSVEKLIAVPLKGSFEGSFLDLRVNCLLQQNTPIVEVGPRILLASWLRF